MFDPAADEPLEVFSDYVCPFSYIAHVVVERALAKVDEPPPVLWHPYDLRRDARNRDGRLDPGRGPDKAYLERVGEGVRRLAASYDIPIVLDAPRNVDSWDAHRVALGLQGEHPGAFPRYHALVFEALWQARRNIGDHAVLVEAAAGAGVDASTTRALLADEELGARLTGALRRAHRAGVTAVPTFVRGGVSIPGALPVEQVELLLSA